MEKFKKKGASISTFLMDAQLADFLARFSA